MLVTRFDPFKEFTNMQKVFQSYPALTKEGDTAISTFTPVVNTREGEFAYHIDVDLPGVNKDDISIDIDDGKLTISGERKIKEEVKEEDYYKVETSFGKFQRFFTIPKNVDVENITASSDKGVLEVVIPKLEKDKNKKKIEIE
ncbi:MAG: Hsp20/alpha crystallin family protein [Arcobacteraceae bacterium]|nr:Hsp20/alpha crystallin family protein [Arcobacteraceae bacterium]